jgi:hypothetical protein
MLMDTAVNPLTVQVQHLRKNLQKAVQRSPIKVPEVPQTPLQKVKPTVPQLSEKIVPVKYFFAGQ